MILPSDFYHSVSMSHGILTRQKQSSKIFVQGQGLVNYSSNFLEDNKTGNRTQRALELLP